MNPPSVRVMANSAGFARALTAYLETQDVRIARSGDEEDAAIVVCPTSDCSPERCHELRRRGLAVVVLAPVPRERDRERYVAAGAEYVPMTVDPLPLLAAIARSRPTTTLNGQTNGLSGPPR